MAKTGKKERKKPAKTRGGRQNLQGTPKKAKFGKNSTSGLNEVDTEVLSVSAIAGDTVTFQNDLKVPIAIILYEPTIGLINANGTPAGDEIASGIRAIVVGGKSSSDTFGTVAPPSTDVHVHYMVVVEPHDSGGDIGHPHGPHIGGGQDPEIIIGG